MKNMAIKVDDDYVFKCYNQGRRAISNGDLIKCYIYINKDAPTPSSCNACFRRKAWAIVSNYASTKLKQ